MGRPKGQKYHKTLIKKLYSSRKEMRIKNMEWDDNLSKKSSEIFLIVSSELKENLKRPVMKMGI